MADTNRLEVDRSVEMTAAVMESVVVAAVDTQDLMDTLLHRHAAEHCMKIDMEYAVAAVVDTQRLMMTFLHPHTARHYVESAVSVLVHIEQSLMIPLLLHR